MIKIYIIFNHSIYKEINLKRKNYDKKNYV